MEASIASFQRGLVLGQQNGNVGAGANLTLSRRRLASGCSFEVLGEGHGVVGGQLGTAGEHLLDSLIEACDLDNGGAAFSTSLR